MIVTRAKAMKLMTFDSGPNAPGDRVTIYRPHRGVRAWLLRRVGLVCLYTQRATIISSYD